MRARGEREGVRREITRRDLLLPAGILLALFVAFLAGFLSGRGALERAMGNPTGGERDEKQEKVTTETTVDTLKARAPEASGQLRLGTGRYVLPEYRLIGGKRDKLQGETGCDSVSAARVVMRGYGTGAGGSPRSCGDSAIVDLPIIQRHYADSTYEAWVSGPVDPQLDSLRVFARRTVVTRERWRSPKRWHIGVTAGYGYGRGGFQPYIGVGITYSIFSF